MMSKIVLIGLSLVAVSAEHKLKLLKDTHSVQADFVIGNPNSTLLLTPFFMTDVMVIADSSCSNCKFKNYDSSRSYSWEAVNAT